MNTLFRRAFCCAVVLASASSAADGDTYQTQVHPFMKRYCLSCHNSKETKGELDLSNFRTEEDVIRGFRKWHHVIEFVRGGAMPPQKAKQPTIAERKKAAAAIEQILLREALKTAGDPGFVPPRRLSNTEYDRSIQALTGVAIQATKEFPADPAGGEGFDNTGEALTMSPSLLRKYLSAAQHVADHMVLTTNGIRFAPFPVTSYNERKKLTEQAIIDFYHSHEVKIEDYIHAAWRIRSSHKNLSQPRLAEIAKQEGLSPKYLKLVWSTLQSAHTKQGPLKQIGDTWKGVQSKDAEPADLNELIKQIKDTQQVLNHPHQQLIRSNAGNWPIKHLSFRAQTAQARDKPNESAFSPQMELVTDKYRKPKEKSDSKLVLKVNKIDSKMDEVALLVERPVFSKNNRRPRNDKEKRQHGVFALGDLLKEHQPALYNQLGFGEERFDSGKVEKNSLVLRTPIKIEIPLNDLADSIDVKHFHFNCRMIGQPQNGVTVQLEMQQAKGKRPWSAERALMSPNSKIAEEWRASAAEFCNAFHNRFFYVNDKRGLAAGFNLVEGFFRDDRPLVTKVLSSDERLQLDRLWQELDFVTKTAETLIRGFVWFERSERHVLHDKRFDFLRPEDQKLVELALLDRFERIYLEKMGVKLLKDSLKPEQPHPQYEMIHTFFEQIREGLAIHRKTLKRSEALALKQLQEFTRRAYKRNLTDRDRDSQRKLYTSLRQQGIEVESALRGLVIALLMSPEFCYRYSESANEGDVVNLTGRALANRLSYFLWSSLPDEELLAAANSNQLMKPSGLEEQARRMLTDSRIEAFAREFLGQWLRYRAFPADDHVNAAAFPKYTNSLRAAMAEEPVRLATYLLKNDLPITRLIDSDETFVNADLAKHYGGDLERQFKGSKSQEDWRKVTGLKAAGRGGLLGMAVVLTTNSAGERTSPVKRGFWTVHHLLGQHFPPPPADVPELPDNEKEAKATIRELMAKHAADANCAICHTHFDQLGLTMEGFDPIGRARRKDLAGRAIDDSAKLPDGRIAKGVPGLINYVIEQREKDFVRTFCRKFLGYALGRSVILSDEPLLQEMEKNLRENDYRFSVLFTTVVKSRQFRMQRGNRKLAAKTKVRQ